MQTWDSLHRAVVAHFKEWSAGKISSIVCQLSSFSSRALASVTLVGFLSERVADTAHLCSQSWSNISHSEFHRVRQYWISLWFGRFCSTCFLFWPAIETVLWWKCDTSLLHAVTTWLTLAILKPSLIAGCRVYAKHRTDSRSRRPWFANTILLQCAGHQNCSRLQLPSLKW